eukprot:GHVP01019910.1.p1 GENE.GHVP01019910.1~~GHVP01019910.1.p1  ORF type:complete len:121 (+),score=20.03 GHVP01019910.1:287-649(+)
MEAEALTQLISGKEYIIRCRIDDKNITPYLWTDQFGDIKEEAKIFWFADAFVVATVSNEDQTICVQFVEPTLALAAEWEAAFQKRKYESLLIFLQFLLSRTHYPVLIMQPLKVFRMVTSC